MEREEQFQNSSVLNKDITGSSEFLILTSTLFQSSNAFSLKCFLTYLLTFQVILLLSDATDGRLFTLWAKSVTGMVCNCIAISGLVFYRTVTVTFSQHGGGL